MSDFFDAFLVQFFPKPLITSFLEKKRALVLDRSNDSNDRMMAITLLRHQDFLDDTLRIAKDKTEDYGVRMGSILNCLLYQTPKHPTDVITDANAVRQQALVDLVVDKSEERLVRLDAIRALRGHAQNHGSYDYPLSEVLNDKSELDEIRSEIVYKASVDSNALCYKSFILSIICIAEDQSERLSLRAAAIRALDPQGHRDILRKLKESPERDIRYAATAVLHGD